MDTLPTPIKQLIPGKPLFTVQSQRRVPARRAITTVAFGVCWMVGFAIGMYFMGETRWWGTIVLVAAIIVGFLIVTRGLYDYFAPGPWYIGSKQFLYEYRNEQLYAMPWKQFRGVRTTDASTLVLVKRSGHYEGVGQGRWGHPAGHLVTYVPDKLYIIGSRQLREVKKEIEKRLQH